MLSWCQMMIYTDVVQIIVKVVAASSTLNEVLGNAFGVAVLNEFCKYATIAYMLYLEPFNHKIHSQENFLKGEITQ